MYRDFLYRRLQKLCCCCLFRRGFPDDGSAGGAGFCFCCREEAADRRQMAAGQSASLLVNGTDLKPVVFYAADIQVPFRADDKGVFTGFSLADVGIRGLGCLT